jgi:gliding motility-associated-like protein
MGIIGILPVWGSAQFDPGGIRDNQCAVNGVAPSRFKSVRDASGVGSFTYQWESSLSSSGPFTPIPFETGTEYQSPILVTETYFRRAATSVILGGPPLYSNVIRVTVVATVAIPNFSIVLPTNPNLCNGAISFRVFYNNVPPVAHEYSIIWDDNAVTHGFTDINAEINGGGILSASSGFFDVIVPAGATVASSPYVGRLTAVNTSSGCAFTGSSSLTIHPLPSVNITNPSAVCTPGTIDLTAAPVTNGSTAGLTFTYWTDAAASITFSTPTVATNGTYYIKGTTSFFTGNCTDIQPVSAIVNPLPVITGGLDVCIGSTTSLNGSGTAAAANPWVSSNTSVATVNSIGLVTGLASGTSVITYTNNNGCSQTASVTVNSLPVITGTLTVCPGLTTGLNGSGTAAAVNPWVSSNTLAATVNSVGLVTGVASGTSVITYTNNNGCSQTASVTVNSLPIITGTLTVCFGLTTGLNGSGTAAAVNPWVSTNTSVATVNSVGLVTGVASGTSVITYTNNNGCSQTASVTVNTLPTITGTLTVCAGSTISLNGSATVAAINPWISSNTAVATVDNMGLVAGISAGTAAITYTNNNGCSQTASVTINALPTITGTLNVCKGSTTSLAGSATSAAVNPWTSFNISIATVNNAGLVTGISAGTTAITYTNDNGCARTASVLVNALPTIIGGLSVCTSSTSLLTGSGTATAVNPWISTNTSIALVNNAGLVTGVSVGTTVITYTNNNGCAQTVNITVNALPVITGTLTICAGLTTTLTGSATAAAINPWISSSSSVATVNSAGVVTAIVPGTAAITYTNGNGCVRTAGITVNALPPVAAVAGASTACLNNTTTLTNTTPAGTWTSSNNSIATVTASGLVAGISLGVVTITYTVTNSNGCVNSSSAAITVVAVPAVPTITASGPVALCTGGSVVLASSSSTGNQWYRNGVLLAAQTNSTYTATTAGNYTVQVTNGNGCVSSSPSLATTVTVNLLPAAGISGTTAVCQNAAAPSITFTGSNASAPYTFTYQLNGGANQTITTVSGNSVTLPATTGAAGAFVYTLVSVKDGSATACSNSATGAATITVNPLPTATIGGSAAVCQNASAPIISFTSANGTAPYTFTYSLNGGANQNLTTTPGNSISITALTGTAGVFTYTLISVKDASPAACTVAVNATATIVVNPLPTGIIQTPATNYICDGIPQILTASTADNYQWYLDNAIINGATGSSYPATAAGDYSVQLRTKEGCVNNAANSVKLILYTRPVLGFIPDKQCLDNPVTFINRSSFASSGNITWQWDLGDGNSASVFSPSHVYNAESMYTISLTANNTSCPNLTEKITAAYFIESPRPGVRYPAITAVVNKPVTINARAFGAKYLWQPFTGLSNYTVQSPIATPATQQEYTVEITSAEGCVTTDTVLIKLFPGSEIYVPQGFTPNGDGQNDTFYPILVRTNKLNYFKVFNRWGNLVFQTNDATPANGWNGKYNGTNQPAGTYTWIAEAVDADGNIIKRSGNVLLIR